MVDNGSWSGDVMGLICHTPHLCAIFLTNILILCPCVLVETLWPEFVRFDLHSRPVCSIFSGRDCGWCCVVSMVRAYHGPDTEPEPGNAGDWVTGGAEGRRIDTRGPRGKGTWPTYLPGACYVCTKHNTSYNKRVDMYLFVLYSIRCLKNK